MSSTNSTVSTTLTSDLAIGYASLFVSCAAFGFMFAPLKRLEAKDGVFVQWVQCSVVFVAGLVLNVVRGLPPFNLVAAIGGFLYATGNVASVPIVAEMGIGLGMLIWGSVQIIVGWSVAHFGLFGTKAQSVANPLLNYLGVFITLLSGLMFVIVYSRESDDDDDGNGGGNKTNFESRSSPSTGPTTTTTPSNYYGTVPNVWAVDSEEQHHSRSKSAPKGRRGRLSQALGSSLRMTKRKMFFIALALCLGSLHGLMLTPIVYVQDNDPNASRNVLDYVFSHFSAVFFFSTLYFIVYSIIMKGKPFIQQNLVLPSVAYGLLWTLGMTLFIVSNRLLSQTVSFPITVRLPAIIGAVADVFIFKSIKGKMRVASLFFAIVVGSVGVTLVGLSLY